MSESRTKPHKPSLDLGSDLRQVPDTQEVFVYPDSQISIVVEVLQRVAPDDDTEAAKFGALSISPTKYPTQFPRFHFDSLADDNSAVSSSVGSVTTILNNGGDKNPTPIVLKGNQLVHKFNSTVPDEILILLAIFRVASKKVDLVLSMNIPLQTAGGEAAGAKCQEAQHDFETAVKSLHILDLDLFV